MGLSPSELEGYTHAQFVIKSKGFQNSKDREEQIKRRMTYLIMRPHLSEKSKFNIEKVWPILTVDGKNKFRTDAYSSREKIRAMLEAESLNLKKPK